MRTATLAAWLLTLIALPSVAFAADPAIPEGMALVHIYRLKSIAGMGASFDVYAGDKLICELKEGTGCATAVPPGEIEIWSRFLSKGSVTLDVEAGREYYVRGSVTKGPLFLWRPHYAEVLERIGKGEIARLVGDAPEDLPQPQGWNSDQ